MAFSFGNTTGTPGPSPSPFAPSGTGTGTAFGTSGGLFGSQNNTSFGSQPAFGASTGQGTPGFGNTTPGQTPAFGAASKPGMFGAASTPSIFGGAAAGPSTSPHPAGGFSFTPSSTHSFLNPAGNPGAGGTFQNQASAQAHQQLITKDNRPISLSTNWDDLSPQAQQYLLELECVWCIFLETFFSSWFIVIVTVNHVYVFIYCRKIVGQYGQECKQLEDQDQLVSGDDATTDINQQAKIISQNISALSIRESFDSSEAENLRKAAVHLVRHTEAAVYSFKRATMWRNMTRTNSSSNHVEDLGPPMSLPYPFLAETLEEFKGRLQAQLSAVYELEVTIKEKNRNKTSTPDTSLAALQAAITNLHDCVMKVAALIQEMDDKVGVLKAKTLKEMNRKGFVHDPFRDAALNERKFRSGQQSSIIKAYDDYKQIHEEQVGTYAKTISLSVVRQ